MTQSKALIDDILSQMLIVTLLISKNYRSSNGLKTWGLSPQTPIFKSPTLEHAFKWLQLNSIVFIILAPNPNNSHLRALYIIR